MSLGIPTDAFYMVSSLSFERDEMCARLVADFLPSNPLDAGAWKLQVIGASHALSAFDFLSLAKERNESIMGYEEDGFLVLAHAYDDVDLRISAEVVSSEIDGLSREELSECLSSVKAHSENKDKALAATNKRVKTVLDLLAERIRRTEIKASSHQQDSTAGVLYAQQLQLLKHLQCELQG